jgi:transposase
MKRKSEKKVAERVKQFQRVKANKITLKQASLAIRLSYKETERLYARFLEGGSEALRHGNAGRRPKNKTDEETLAKAVSLYEEKYNDFGPKFGAEKIAENEGLKVSVSVFRRALIAKKLWEPSKNAPKHRSRRAPKEHFGEMIQFDGSPHDWFEGRGPRCCLMTLIDDATKTRLSQFFEEETMFAAMIVLKMWIRKYGIPASLYCDHKNAFVLTREPTEAEQLKGIEKPKSHFGRACDTLGIEVIAANSPQAKGRVERNHGVDQKRLTRELRLAGISTMPEANKFLLDYYLPKMNETFTHLPKKAEDFHVPALDADLDNILCLQFDRKISKDYIVRYNGRLFQILASNKPLPKTQEPVILRVWTDESVHIFWKDKPLLFEEVSTIFDD